MRTQAKCFVMEKLGTHKLGSDEACTKGRDEKGWCDAREGGRDWREEEGFGWSLREYGE